MARSVMRTLLVTGKNHAEIAARYSADTRVNEYLFRRYTDAAELKENRLRLLREMIESGLVRMTESEREMRRDEYLEIASMDVFENYVSMCKGCRFDEETFDAYSTENPDAKYKYEKCYQDRLLSTGEEGPLSNPFILLDGTKSYSAKVKDIDWDMVHMHNTELYERVWAMCVDGETPINSSEREIYERMCMRRDYFSNFSDAEEYARHSCSFWCYGVIDKNGKYHEPDLTVTDKEWVSGFYDRFVKTLGQSDLLTIYEVRSLKD